MEGGETKKPIVILIHGTFASSETLDEESRAPRFENRGARWWQESSDFYEAFEGRLAPLGVTVSKSKKEWNELPYFEDSLVFHWDGNNSERSRHQAANALLDKLIELENDRQPYHLVSHSHGGSIIWTALQEAIDRRWRSPKNEEALRLTHLRSWNTVATPFFQFKASWLAGWPGAIATAFDFALLSVSLFLFFFYILLNFFYVNFVDPTMHDVTWRVVAEELQTQLVPKVATTLHGAKDFLIKPILGERDDRWVLLGTFLLVLVALQIHGLIHVGRVEAHQLRRQIRTKRQAFIEFGSRWLGIWSDQDEAINGLKASVKLAESDQNPLLAPVRVPNRRVFRSDIYAQLSKYIVLTIVGPIYNRRIRRQIDGQIWKILRRQAVGLDRPGCNIETVSQAPYGFSHTLKEDDLRLPPEVDQELIAAANRRLSNSDLLSTARTSLANYSKGLDTFSGAFNSGEGLLGPELIHNSYFNHPQIIEILCQHIAHQEGVSAPSPESPNSSLGTWLQRGRTRLNQEIASFKSSEPWKDPALPLLGQPNRWAVSSLVVWMSPLLVFVWAQNTSPSDLGPIADKLISLLLAIFAVLPVSLAALFIAIPAKRRAKRGARKGWMANLSLKASLVVWVPIVGWILATLVFNILVGTGILEPER
tara:strand:- start:3772 stop:5721 length:1950 start_codon:yes stop_codon:yes gene_type:complete